MGFELKVSVARALEDVDYCSGRVVMGSEGVARWVRAWPKPLVTDPWTARPVDGESARSSKAYSMAVSAWVQYQGVPVYQAWGEWLVSWATPRRFDAWYERDVVLRLAGVAREVMESGRGGQKEMCPSLRASFSEATGVGKSEQERMETWLHANRGPFPPHPVSAALAALASAGR